MWDIRNVSGAISHYIGPSISANRGIHITLDLITIYRRESRQFGFVGFNSIEAAETAVKKMNKTFIGTSKIICEPAFKVRKDKTGKMENCFCQWAKLSLTERLFLRSSQLTRVSRDHGQSTARVQVLLTGRKRFVAVY